MSNSLLPETKIKSLDAFISAVCSHNIITNECYKHLFFLFYQVFYNLNVFPSFSLLFACTLYSLDVLTVAQ